MPLKCAAFYRYIQVKYAVCYQQISISIFGLLRIMSLGFQIGFFVSNFVFSCMQIFVVESLLEV